VEESTNNLYRVLPARDASDSREFTDLGLEALAVGKDIVIKVFGKAASWARSAAEAAH
jgi:hypothetical protein